MLNELRVNLFAKVAQFFNHTQSSQPGKNMRQKIKNKTSALVSMILSATIAGCSVAPIAVDVSDSNYNATASPAFSRKSLRGFEIKNLADDGKVVNTMLGSDSIFPIRPQVKTKQTVESDLKNFFSEVVTSDELSNKTLIITISKANSYWVWGGASKLPILGILAVGADTEFGMNLRVLFEIEDNGKVVSSYIFDDKITIQGGAATTDSIVVSYKALIAEYRKKFFTDLENRFVSRYL